jgi:hypothetical protein
MINGKTQKLAWEKKWTYEAPPPQAGPDGQVRPPQRVVADPKHYNWLQPQGSTDVPVIGERDANGVRPIYLIAGCTCLTHRTQGDRTTWWRLIEPL